MHDIVNGSVVGVAYGCVYAIIALGLVLTYKTSGVFNLAYGAQAFVAAVAYYDTHVRHGWPIWLALVFAVLVVSPLLGLILDRALFRFMRTASSTAKLVIVLGLIVGIPETVKAFWVHGGTLGIARTSGIVTRGGDPALHIGTIALSRDEIATIVVTVLAAGALTLMFRYSRLGLQMRSVVESPRLAQLAGINSETVSMVSWMLCSALAGLGGVLLGPLSPSIDPNNYTTLIIAATAAAAMASLVDIPLAFVFAIAIGVVEQILNFSLPTGSTLLTGLRPSLPFAVLVGALVLNPRVRNRREATDPLSGVDPPPPAPPTAIRSKVMRNGTYGWWTVVLGLLGYYIFFHAAFNWVSLTIEAVIIAIILLSITVFTGIAGEVSLCQAAFAGIGACVAGQLIAQQQMSGLLAALIGGLVAAAAGVVIALPSLRLSGIYLSLVTFAFALFFDNILAPQNWMARPSSPFGAADIPRPQLGPFDFASDKSFLVLCIVLFLAVAGLVVLVRNGTTGRFLTALRGSEAAAASIGISRVRMRLTTFAFSAGIAGFGGGLYTLWAQNVQVQTAFPAFLGLFFVVLVVTLSPRTIQGAIQAGVGYVFFQIVVLQQAFPWIVNHVQPWYHMENLPAGLFFVFFGFGAVTYARHPEGILEFQTRKSVEKMQARLEARAARKQQRSAPEREPEPAGVA